MQIRTQSVNSKPGRTAFTRTLGPWVWAKHRIRWSWAALVTEYAMELPPIEAPATLDVMIMDPPGELENIG
jgi:hypothetical protein